MKRQVIIYSCLFLTGLNLSGAPIVTFGGTPLAGQGVVTSLPGAFTINFNSGSAPTTGPAIYSGGTVQNISNAAGTQLGGNTSYYLTIGPLAGTPTTIDFDQPMQYFGFNAGSLDTFNRIQFYAGSLLVADIPGNGLSQFVNVTATQASDFFTRIVLSSTGNAFETDNHAFRSVVGGIEEGDLPDGIGGIFLDPRGSGVPEPSTSVIVGGGLLALGLLVRKSNHASSKRQLKS